MKYINQIASPVQIRDGHDNFFTPLRIFMAVMVLIGHAIMLPYGDPSGEPALFFHYRPSYIAVNMFFIASGFLVTKSMLYRGDLGEYAAARILRIFPALFIHVMLVVFVAGLLLTRLPASQYLTDIHVLLQPFKVLSFVDTDMVLPGLFEDNPEQYSSATLWTLRYEVMAYIGTAILFALGFMKKAWMIAAQYVVCVIAYIASIRLGIIDNLPATAVSLLRFGVAYGLGAAIYAYQDRIKLYWPIIPVLFAITALLYPLGDIEILFNIALAYAMFWLAYAKCAPLERLQKSTDISYGIYIYHWVVLQIMFAWVPELSPAMRIIIALIITVALSYASWIFVEKPALGLKKRFSRKARQSSKAILPAE